MADGESISNDELDKCAKDQNVAIGRGDFVHDAHRADGTLPGEEVGRLCRRRRARCKIRELLLVPGKGDRGDLHRHLGCRSAAERDHRSKPALALGGDPRHGPVHGRDFYLKELAEDCEEDGVYEFFFCGPPLVITGGTGSPINPQAIK